MFNTGKVIEKNKLVQ